MKLQYRQIESFVKSPDPAARAILIYGPDSGLMKERAKIIGKTVVKDLNDPFNVAVLSADLLIEDPARLSDEANAISMMGGDRLIRIEDASDKLTPLLKDYLAAPAQNALVILEAGELGPRSSLRLLFEKSPAAAALPCYVEDERDLSRFIRDTVQESGLRIEADAVAWLAANISGDRLKARMEVEKLITYKGDEDSAINLNDAQNACGEAGAQGLDEMVYCVAGRQSAKAAAIYQKLMEEDVSFMMVLRGLQNHFRRLHLTKARMREGIDLAQSLKMLSPPIFFKQEPAFRAQVESWSMKGLDTVLSKLMDLEAQCKQTGAVPETLCAQAVLGISFMKG